MDNLQIFQFKKMESRWIRIKFSKLLILLSVKVLIITLLH